MSRIQENLKIVAPNLSRLAQFKRIKLLLVGLVLAISFFFRFFNIDGNSLWTDEFTTWLLSSQSRITDVFSLSFQIPQPVPPLYFLANKFFYGFLSQNEASLRFLSVLSGFLTTWYVFRIGNDLFNPLTGLMGAFLFAINSFQLFQAHNARPYALGLLLCVISMYYFIQLLKKAPSIFIVTAYILSTILMVYTHFFFLVQVMIQNSYLVWRMISEPPLRERWKCWVVAQSVLFLTGLSLLGQFWQIQSRSQSYNWAGALFPPIDRLFVFIEPQVLLWAALITALIWVVVVIFRGKQESSDRTTNSPSDCGMTSHLVLLFLWYFFPLLLFYLFSWSTGVNIFIDRYLIMSSVPALLLIPAVAQRLFPLQWSMLFLALYAGSYFWMIPCRYYRETGQFHPRPPGGDQWRESLPLLSDPRLQAPLRLFFSPFYESNHSDFLSRPELLQYFSSPYHSFYCQAPIGNFQLMPFSWDPANPSQRRLQAEIMTKIEAAGEFVIFCPRNYWEQFGSTLSQTFSGKYQIKEVVRFESSGVLQIRKVQLVPDEAAR
jgi:hypothetical protein